MYVHFTERKIAILRFLQHKNRFFENHILVYFVNFLDTVAASFLSLTLILKIFPATFDATICSLPPSLFLSFSFLLHTMTFLSPLLWSQRRHTLSLHLFIFSLSFTYSNSFFALSLLFSLSLSLVLFLSLSLLFSFSLSHTHTHTSSLSPPLWYPFSLFLLSLSLSLTHTILDSFSLRSSFSYIALHLSLSIFPISHIGTPMLPFCRNNLSLSQSFITVWYILFSLHITLTPILSLFLAL